MWISQQAYSIMELRKTRVWYTKNIDCSGEEMVKNYCPEVKLNPALLFTEARRAEVNSTLYMWKSGFPLFVGVKRRTICFWVGKYSKRSKRGFLMTMFHSFESENLTFTLILGWKFSTLKQIVLRLTHLTPFRVNFHSFHSFYI